MATAGPLPHFVGPNVLDPLFQRMRARGLAPREVQRRILEALKCEKLIIMWHVAAGAWSLQARQYATREEEVQAQQKALAALEKFDRGAYHAIVFEQSPSPDGIIGPIGPEDWEVTVIIAIRDGHLVIELLDPQFPPKSYSFTIASPPEEVDELLAAATSSVHASSTAVSLNPPAGPNPPADNVDGQDMATMPMDDANTPEVTAKEVSPPSTAVRNRDEWPTAKQLEASPTKWPTVEQLGIIKHPRLAELLQKLTALSASRRGVQFSIAKLRDGRLNAGKLVEEFGPSIRDSAERLIKRLRRWYGLPD